ncbi:MAG: flagellin [Bacteroidetes bacterium]|nr:flagellin [Bacteroidota bacterium]
MASFGDFNRVNTNVSSLGARLSLNKINSELGDSRLKLSTGKRINSAEDNSAGYAIATKLNSRVKGLEQALQNVSDAKSVLDIIESSYNSIMDNLIEIKRLGLQAANDTLSQSERTLIAKQIQGKSKQINDLADSTSFNNLSLNPLTDKTLSFQVGESTLDTIEIIAKKVDITALFGNELILGKANSGDFLDSDIFVRLVDDHDNLDGNTENDVRGEIHFRTVGLTSSGNLLADSEDFNIFTSKVDTAVEILNGYLNELGINQRSLSSKEENLTQAITANSAAHSRIMDTDFAKEQSNSIRLQILQQTATAALSQANMGPQAVLGFLGQ